MDTLDTAQDFIWRTGRLLERLRFEHLVGTLPAEPVVAALAAYRNPDGGFGNGLEPDFRGPVSQPTTSDYALRVLDELARPEPELVRPLFDWLATVSTPEGGVPTVLADGADYPRAPWWNPDPEQKPNLLPTAGLAGFLHRYGIAHPWLEPATAWTWTALEAVPDRLAAGEWVVQVAYEARAGIAFLDAVPDRERALGVAGRLGPALIDGGAILMTPGDRREGMLPLDAAPTPHSIARRWFDDATIEAHLDAVLAEQQDDGGWTVPWEFWTPAVEPEWRGIQTVERLRVLRAYGRV
ncbi:MAG TPA: hypothetical protein VF109_06010 [Mycobacteriales bacterium]